MEVARAFEINAYVANGHGRVLDLRVGTHVARLRLIRGYFEGHMARYRAFRLSVQAVFGVRLECFILVITIGDNRDECATVMDAHLFGILMDVRNVRRTNEIVANPTLRWVHVVFKIIVNVAGRAIRRRTRIGTFPEYPGVRAYGRFQVIEARPCAIIHVGHAIAVDVRMFSASCSKDTGLCVVFKFVLVRLLLNARRSVYLRTRP